MRRANGPSTRPINSFAAAQVPGWSAGDMAFFLHGSMSSEMVPEDVLRAFIKTYPDLFPTQDLSHLGLIADSTFGWPIGISRARPAHLGGLPSLGVNCAACHVAQVEPADGGTPVRVLGVTSHFDAEAFFGSIIVAGFRTQDPDNMKRFLREYLAQKGDDFEQKWSRQQSAVVAAINDDPAGAKGTGLGGLHALNERDLRQSEDLAALSRAMLKLFHNMRAALHVPDQPPEKTPPASGPGRNDAFGLLSLVLFRAPQPYAPVKYGVVWNLRERHWVHWDGNTQSPIGRNLLASIGLGAPLVDNRAQLDVALVQRQTDLSEDIRSPQYPFAIDRDAARRGEKYFRDNCVRCHGGAESDKRLYAASEVGTDPVRAQVFTTEQAGNFNKFLSDLRADGYHAAAEPGIRGTQKYWAPTLSGAWARSPYLHNGSVRTMRQLLTPPPQREKSFHRGSRSYDTHDMGYTDGGGYLFDTTAPGNFNTGHDYGTNLSDDQKRELIEYLKSI